MHRLSQGLTVIHGQPNRATPWRERCLSHARKHDSRCSTTQKPIAESMPCFHVITSSLDRALDLLAGRGLTPPRLLLSLAGQAKLGRTPGGQTTRIRAVVPLVLRRPRHRQPPYRLLDLKEYSVVVIAKRDVQQKLFAISPYARIVTSCPHANEYGRSLKLAPLLNADIPVAICTRELIAAHLAHVTSALSNVCVSWHMARRKRGIVKYMNARQSEPGGSAVDSVLFEAFRNLKPKL